MTAETLRAALVAVGLPAADAAKAGGTLDAAMKSSSVCGRHSDAPDESRHHLLGEQLERAADLLGGEASSEFKHRCLEIIRRVEESGKPVAITRRGKVVARLDPSASSIGPSRQKPWAELRALGGRLRAKPSESVLRDEDYETGTLWRPGSLASRK